MFKEIFIKQKVTTFFDIMLHNVISRRNLGKISSAGSLVNFLNTKKILLSYIVLHTFSYFFLAVKDVILNRTLLAVKDAILNRTQGTSLFI